MPEVAVLSLFLSEAERPQLRAPAWVLGARMVLEGGTVVHQEIRNTENTPGFYAFFKSGELFFLGFKAVACPSVVFLFSYLFTIGVRGMLRIVQQNFKLALE